MPADIDDDQKSAEINFEADSDDDDEEIIR